METTGPQKFGRPIPLASDILVLAREEFDHKLELGIIQPTINPWASTLQTVPKSSGSRLP